MKILKLTWLKWLSLVIYSVANSTNTKCWETVMLYCHKCGMVVLPMRQIFKKHLLTQISHSKSSLENFSPKIWEDYAKWRPPAECSSRLLKWPWIGLKRRNSANMILWLIRSVNKSSYNLPQKHWFCRSIKIWKKIKQKASNVGTKNLSWTRC